ncbi:hypothetical protein WAI453_012849 [Rhynchosporium graminicola]
MHPSMLAGYPGANADNPINVLRPVFNPNDSLRYAEGEKTELTPYMKREMTHGRVKTTK